MVLHGDKTFALRQQKFRVSESLKTGESVALFGQHLSLYAIRIHFDLCADYLADSVDAFLTKEASIDYDSVVQSEGDQDPVLLGLTFSFPVEQTALDSGKILTWTKGFSAKNAIGNDVVKLLQDAFDRKRMHVKCVALVNDVGVHSFLVNGLKGDHGFIDRRSSTVPCVRCWRLLARCHFRNRNQWRICRADL